MNWAIATLGVWAIRTVGFQLQPPLNMLWFQLEELCSGESSALFVWLVAPMNILHEPS